MQTQREKAAVPTNETTLNVLSLLFSLSPIYFLSHYKSRLGLQTVHLSLLQVLLVLLCRQFLERFKAWSKPSSASTTSIKSEEKGKEILSEDEKLDTGRRKHSPSPSPELLHSFLSLTNPSPTLWTLLHTSPLANLNVYQNPLLTTSYAISATFPRVSVRQLWETLGDLEKRLEWDKMVEGVERVVERQGDGEEVVWVGMKGLLGGLVGAKDLCLSSSIGRIEDEGGTLTLVCASKSIAHPLCPSRKGFKRIKIGVSGFIISSPKLGTGSEIIQVADLSGLGSWIPASVINAVTQTFIPKSLIRLGEVAEKRVVVDDGDYSWLPPLIRDENENEIEDDDEEIPSSSSSSNGVGRGEVARLKEEEKKRGGLGGKGVGVIKIVSVTVLLSLVVSLMWNDRRRRRK